ncbi:MAG: hypothetical protein R3E39_01585 [Anaerolineae bacterium]
MSKKTTESPFQALEQEAYHAFREWPIWLVLRERELDAHLDGGKPTEPAAGAAGIGTALTKPRGHSPLDKRGK